MPRPPLEGLTITYEKVQALTDLPLNTLHKAGAGRAAGEYRQKLNLDSLESVVLWLACHGTVSLRKRICAHAAQSLLDSGALPGVPRTRKKKRPATN